MPGATLPAGWTTTVQPQYDAAGNVTRIDRTTVGGASTLLESDYRASGRPKHRTLHVNAASPLEIRREYDYEPAAGRLNAFRVFAGSTLMAGSAEHEASKWGHTFFFRSLATSAGEQMQCREASGVTPSFFGLFATR